MNNDYELEEMENEAVKKSGNWKKGAAIGAATIAAGTGVAFGAERIMNADSDGQSDEFNSEDLLSGAQAGAVEEENLGRTTTVENHTHENVHVYHHIVNEPPAGNEVIEQEPDVQVNESAVLYDDEGNPVAQMDSGTVSGTDFVVVDKDLDGEGDMLWVDVNHNGAIDNGEVSDIKGQGYIVGQSENKTAYIMDDQGEVGRIDVGPDVVDRDDIDDIHNDFHDERTGEVYRDDLAENNPDYRSDGEVSHYSASMDGGHEVAEVNYDDDGGDPATLPYNPANDIENFEERFDDPGLAENDIYDEPADIYDSYTADATDSYQADDFTAGMDDIANDAVDLV